MSARTAKLIVLAAVLALFVAPLYMAPFTITLLNYIGVYSLVTLGLVLLTGIAGIVDEYRVATDGSLTKIGSVTVPDAIGGEGIAAS